MVRRRAGFSPAARITVYGGQSDETPAHDCFHSPRGLGIAFPRLRAKLPITMAETDPLEPLGLLHRIRRRRERRRLELIYENPRGTRKGWARAHRGIGYARSVLWSVFWTVAIVFGGAALAIHFLA
ncbi:hypothetical protein [Tropicimonas marinistellae]|uniref:hypothetical protein n=1 Tax=Tropicimonas marinistellae TaxID=1739787 RepID=UPI00082C47A9|nr:hypothetical protein [Tropicimonas marinistellae]